jgi:hypothetical protein
MKLHLIHLAKKKQWDLHKANGRIDFGVDHNVLGRCLKEEEEEKEG